VSFVLPEEFLESILSRLSQANLEFSHAYPGENDQRQPVHTVYGGAHRFKPDTIPKLGLMASEAFAQVAPDANALAELLDCPNTPMLEEIHAHVVEKLKREAVEDFRIDFEDGFGVRSDAEEDEVAIRSARALAEAMRQSSVSPYIGIRIKALSEECKQRSLRTLMLFLGALLEATDGKLPEHFVVTLPKVIHREQVFALAAILRQYEERQGLPLGIIQLEMMMESPQLLIDSHGHCHLPELVQAAQGRCRGMHFGPYDYLAANQITSGVQNLLHPACDHARSVLRTALAGTGLWLSDGPTNVMPIAPHRSLTGNVLSSRQLDENLEAIFLAWRLSAKSIRHALAQGYYQGWDLHPSQIPIRYVVLFQFFRESMETASHRLRQFMDQAAQTSMAGHVFDDAATGQGLLNFFLRALNCGAITEQELTASGLTLEEIRCRNFKQIMERRRFQHDKS